MKKYALIVAGGKGERMKSAIPKQFLLLNGKPILQHTIEAFEEVNDLTGIILVLPLTDIGRRKKILENYKSKIPLKIIIGGQSRFESVKKGLDAITEGLVAIHDGVRPLVRKTLIEHAFASSELYGNAIPVVPLQDSIRKIEGAKSKTCDRSRYVAVQTPQVFQSALIKEAYSKATDNASITDDASVFELAGYSIHHIDGNDDNIKITSQKDMIIAEALLKSKK